MRTICQKNQIGNIWQALQKESVVRQLATVVNATRSDSRIYAFDCEGRAEWGDVNDAEDMNNEDDFKRFDVQAYRLLELVKMGTVFTSDQSFAIEDFVIGKMARCFGTSEEQTFINGTGVNSRQAFCMPLTGQKLV